MHIIAHSCVTLQGCQMALVVKNPPANAGDIKMWVQSLVQEDPLEKGIATHSSILAWKISWTEKPDGLQSIGLQRVGHWSDLECTHMSHWTVKTASCFPPYRRWVFLSKRSWEGRSGAMIFNQKGKAQELGCYIISRNFLLFSRKYKTRTCSRAASSVSTSQPLNTQFLWGCPASCVLLDSSSAHPEFISSALPLLLPVLV